MSAEKNLYLQYEEMPRCKWAYYYDATKMCFDDFSKGNAYKFIKSTYETGAKDRIFDVGFQESFKDNGKHEHTVALYFLGCLFSELIDAELKDYLSKFIKDTSWYSFLYTWFLTCLYHDTAAVIEKAEWSHGCPSNLDFYLCKYNVTHNVFEQEWDEPGKGPYTYPENLVKNYFTYRVEQRHSIDHGIIAGYLLYDRLIKNYDEAWSKYKIESKDEKKNYNNFTHKALCWRKEQHAHFAIVADAIIAHNIWLSADTDTSQEIYRQYGLDTLIYDEKNKINISKNPLLFFLCLLDTIEPVKRFDDYECLKNIHMELTQANDVANIQICSEDKKYMEWLSGLAEKCAWLSVAITKVSLNELQITIKR